MVKLKMKIPTASKKSPSSQRNSTADPNAATNNNIKMASTASGEDTRLLSSKRNSSASNDSLRNLNTNVMDNGNAASNEGYEELFKDSVPCPSCRGLGRVPKELENQLVALIPMKDGRLKPRRTILYVVIAVIICLTTASLLIFFLMPRDIKISSNRPFLQPNHIDINLTSEFANFTVVNHYNVSNNNFYPVKISGVAMKALYSNAIISKSEAYQKSPVEISARSDSDLSVPIDFVLKGKYGSLVSHCMSNWSWIHNLPILFEVTANYSYMGHSEQATLTTFQTVSCHPQPVTPTPTPYATTTTPATTKPTTTTTKTTTTSTTTTMTTTLQPDETVEGGGEGGGGDDDDGGGSSNSQTSNNNVQSNSVVSHRNNDESSPT